ncbi:MAG TPA: hypothetical protein VFQ38_08670 [Longimicrobiales bacterium]|nr:hypothetical protein [Longimicrobiales bacterium]
MGGKRPDQYRVAPGEGTRTDYKWTEDQDDVDLHEGEASRDKAALKGRQMIPPAVLNPAVERLREKEMERERHIHEEEEK